MSMSHDFQQNGERMLKDTRDDAALAHRRIERTNRNLFWIARLSLLSTVLLTAAIAVCWSRTGCKCRCQEVRFAGDVR